MRNFYQKYYNGFILTPTDKLNMDIKNKAPSDKQRSYFDALSSFLTERGVYDGFLGKPRNQKDIHRKINTLRTIMTKNALWDEWQNGGVKDEPTD